MKLIKLGLWVLLFPIMLLLWGIKKKNKLVIIIGIIFSIFFLVFIIKNPEEANNNITQDIILKEIITAANIEEENILENINTADTIILSEDISYSDEMNFLPNNLYMHVIDVGQNEAVYIGYNDFDMIVDGGGDGDYLVSYLTKLGVDDIELMIATHAHTDHISGLDEIINAFDIEKIIYSGETTVTQASKDFFNASLAEGSEILQSDKSETIIINNDLKIEIIEVGDGYSNINNNSVITRVIYKDKAILMCGDIEKKIENLLLSSDIKANIFLANHHGSSSSNSFAFLDAVDPEFIVISTSEDNSYGHPHSEALLNMLIITDKIYGTWLSGDVIFEISSKGEIHVNTDIKVLASDGNILVDNSYTPTSGNLNISELNKEEEYVIITNNSSDDVDITGWELESALGEQKFFFPSFILKAGQSIKIGDSSRNDDIDFHWFEGNGIWNNSKTDPARLYDNYSKLIDERKW